MDLRPYQLTAHHEINQSWAAGNQAVLLVLPTGGGKTVTLSHVIREEPGASIVMAHRAELVAQLSLGLARERVRHRVIGPPDLAKLCVAAHMEELRTSYFDPNAKAGVASVQSIASYKDHSNWFGSVALAVGDEFHHYLLENSFGKALKMFPNARILGVTATPGRADGKGLGRNADGFIDEMVVGPTMRDLINMGFLSKYRVFAPPNNFARSEIPITASGELSPTVVKTVTARSTVLGDVVGHYCDHAMGKLGLTFADSIDNATTIARRFKERGVNAEVLTGSTEGWLRASILRKFKNREVMQIVSVALIDEGFDCPAVEVISDAAATESFARFAQRFGRGLRILAGKDFMLYFDHVGNVKRHGLPDAPREHSLARRDRRTSVKVDDAMPTRTCGKCAYVYEAFLKCCPACNSVPVVAERTSPAHVDGDLVEMLGTPWAAETIKEVARIDGPAYPARNMEPVAVRAMQNRHLERQRAQHALRNVIATWRGWKDTLGHDDSESYKLFYFRYGVDVLTAKTLGKSEAEALTARIQTELDNNGVIAK
jgi:DNA repair protein RadD